MGGPFFKISSYFGKKSKAIPVKILNSMEFSNPIGMSSGWADSPGKISDIHRLGAGVVTSKTITVMKRKGNPHPRLIRGENKLINSMGLPNKGVDWWVKNLKQDNKHPSILSIRGEYIDEWVMLIEKLERFTDIFELNFTCPNTEQGVMDLDTSRKIIEDISSISTKPIWLKLSPEYSPEENLYFVNSIRDKIAGITAINTLPIRNDHLGNPTKQGGLSGDPIYTNLTELLQKLRSEYPSFGDLPIFAVGGINSGKRCWDMIEKYHAFSLSLTAFLMQGPFFYKNMLRFLENRMEENGLTSLQTFFY